MSQENLNKEDEKITGKDVTKEMLKLLFPFILAFLLYAISLFS